MATNTAVSTSTSRRRVRSRKAPTKPTYIPASETRHLVFGYRTSTGHYLAVHHLTALDAANGDGWEPRIGNEFDEVVAMELVAAGLLTGDYAITDAGRFHLADSRWS